ncbi:MAG: hypothetical protein UY82_C0008G0002 [Candidatus Uhrbacteria bacterium GW2011_GWC2_53_7]|uniref:Uncharacterized protein n=1 Tax=Candidatus Uhrbacteria bacterium GW2011_GWC2_53_7 TaxID=1618986 RepID=A0A0G1Y151_9BACT|nr:MAG: hypothetical protein UY82_C0008G0002 [Candidatus Uhrbacteria bacterium GW2011_GWC2_53_7]
MHRQIFIALAGSLFSLTFNTPCHAQTPPPFSPEIRLLLHGTKIFVPSSEDGKPGVGVSLWVIEPNLLDTNPQAQATAGLRLEHTDGWVEFLGGGVFSPTTTSPIVPVFDLRAFVAPARHLHLSCQSSEASKSSPKSASRSRRRRRGKDPAASSLSAPMSSSRGASSSPRLSPSKSAGRTRPQDPPQTSSAASTPSLISDGNLPPKNHPTRTRPDAPLLDRRHSAGDLPIGGA